MQVACGYVRKGISEDALREVLSEERSAKEMSDMMQDILNRQEEDAAVPVTELSDSLQEQLDEALQQKEYLEQQIAAKEKRDSGGGLRKWPASEASSRSRQPDSGTGGATGKASGPPAGVLRSAGADGAGKAACTDTGRGGTKEKQ